MGTRYHGGTPAIPASRRPRPFSFNYLVREPPGRLCWRLPWWENLEEEETGYCCLPSPRSNFAQLLKVMTIMIVCPSRQAACWSGVKAGSVSHSYTAAEKAPSLSALAAYFI